MNSSIDPKKGNYSFRIRMANECFQVYPVTKTLKEFCSDYLDEGNEHCREIELTEADIEYEMKASKRIHGWAAGGRQSAERTALCRKATNLLSQNQVILLHASAVTVSGRAYLFTAPSGTGKSTYAQMWCEHFGQEAQIINDDKPFIRREQQEFIVYGSPFSGRRNRNSNIAVPLQGIACLCRGDHTYDKPMDEDEKWEFLMSQVHRSQEPGELVRTMETLKLLIRKVPVIKMFFTRNPESVQISYDIMSCWMDQSSGLSGDYKETGDC